MPTRSRVPPMGLPPQVAALFLHGSSAGHQAHQTVQEWEMHSAGDKVRSQICFLLDNRLYQTFHTAKLGMGAAGRRP